MSKYSDTPLHVLMLLISITFQMCVPLLLVFIVLKMIDVVVWSWVWVLSPLWLSLIVVGLLMLGYYFYEYFRSRGWS